jgi:hypothetical protein
MSEVDRLTALPSVRYFQRPRDAQRAKLKQRGAHETIIDPVSDPQLRSALSSIFINTRKAARPDGIEGRNTICGDWLGRGKEIKAKGGSEAGRESVKRHDQARGSGWTGIACQTLLPGQTPVGTFSSSQHLLRGRNGFRW